jgi:TonB family protein
MTLTTKRCCRRVGPLSVALAACVVEAQERPKSLEQEAKRQVGNVATLCGLVVAYQCQRPEGTSLLALDKPFERPGVSVAIAPENRSQFGLRFEQRHVLMDVCATGRVEKQKSRYLVRVEEPSQVRLQGDQTSELFVADSVSGCDAGVAVPKLLKEVRPDYSQAALHARIQGVVLLGAVVLTDGQVGDIRVLRSLDSRFGLDSQAVKALRSWRFSPGTVDGTPVPVIVTVELSFRLGR